MNKIVSIICIILMVTGCAGPKRTVLQGVNDAGPGVVVNPLPAAERMTIGIARFTNESIFGSGLFTDAAGDRIGKQAADLLARHLMATQRFNVVERQDMSKLAAEANLMGLGEAQFKQNLAGVDALILGSVVELGRDTTGSSWLIGKKKTQRARARVVLRLVDPKTGQLFYTQEGSGEADLSSSSTLGFGGATGFDSTLEGKAIDAAIVNMINNVVLTLDARR
ncbi:Curli biogenesis system outer membrane secretion channel CsgG [Nitrosomonas cryotolerans]|uniref:Curli biogenesis system outer membrane secretion channel CsgG n=1 Tax=Nitrosomonas cryotolerans ATCC 49181 TaxID=1131553 RepID=A0A1N6G3M8_9PROT|nr:CsgG/HfaB family protein [Nitrosomonas cryotolerans]SFP52634.1 Curli biogenesis system outer membrane secretion channel CsgG [Nitrosomonas cryotolerans]SIO02145.1 Curli biogenesis system outer membrane secretion channel CsgG [Nitrosomonas cryotolerans ATCC 49181]